MSNASNETMESYVFKTNDLDVFKGCAKDESRHSSGILRNIAKGRDMLSKGIQQNKNFV
jgi:hypothetical protein